jgi:hypothetical protein
MIEENPNIDPINPIKMGLFASGTICVTTIVAPEKIPAEPIPAIARPTMKALEVGAPPQRADPTSKTIIAIRNMVFVR